jgi:predicted DNA-binding helix-hairpin-helix protein
MDVRAKIEALQQAAQFDACLEAGEPAPIAGGEADAPRFAARLAGLHNAVTQVSAGGGRKLSVLKVLQTSACEKNCYYCPFRAGRSFRRETLSPDELAAAFDQMQRAGLVSGLFLSSGIIGTVRSMDRMLATVALVRQKYQFRGYVHLKLLPNAETAQIEQAVQLADRVSTNLEAPTPQHLARLAPQKTFAESLVEPLRRARAIIQQQRWQAGRQVATGGMVTQFVVGPAGETDRDLLTTSQYLYRQIGLSRAYYSAFSPVRDTPLAEAPPTSPLREFRLYQGDFLLRRYGFEVGELPFDDAGNLPPHADPKLVWAQRHPEYFPLEVNRAAPQQLLRVPGIGPQAMHNLLRARLESTLRDLGDLRKLGVDVTRATPFVLLNGRRAPVQLALFAG